MSYLLHVRFDFNGKIDETFPFEIATKKMNALPNLKWKIWAANDDETEASGFYLYPTKEAAQARSEEALETLPHYPGISNVSTEIWNVLDDYSIATHAPVDAPLISELG